MTDVDRAAKPVDDAPGTWKLDALVVAVAAVLIFTRLGHYPFWGDEADTVIFGRTAWATGDMSAWYEGNLYAYRNGAPLVNLKNRAAPPLPFYVAAAFWGLAGDNRFWLRFPFALCGVGAIGLMQLAWRRLGFAPAQRLLLGAALACSTSLVLYSRQCRYYSLALLLSVALVYLYAGYDGSRRRLAAIVGTACLLIATQFMNFAALMAALLIDYAAWGQRRRKLSAGEWAALLMPLGVVFAVLVYVYNPLGKELYPVPENRNVLLDRWTLIKWSLRDMNRCEYGVGPLVALAPLVGLYQGLRHGNWLILRLVVGSAVFLVATTALSPQPVDRTQEADVRYLMLLIVPGIALSMLVLLALVRGRIAWALPLVGLALFSNLVHQPLKRERWQSSLAEFLHELRTPRRPASGVIADWLKEKVPPGDWVAVLPSDWIAPQLVLAPHVRYGWQLTNPKRADDFAGLDPRMYLYRAPVDVIVLQGFADLRETFERDVLPKLLAAGQSYELTAVLDVFYDDRTRPELIWHWFRDQAYDKEKNAVYLYRRASPSFGPP